MGKIEAWLTGLLWVAVALLLPMAAFEPATAPAAATAAISL